MVELTRLPSLLLLLLLLSLLHRAYCLRRYTHIYGIIASFLFLPPCEARIVRRFATQRIEYNVRACYIYVYIYIDKSDRGRGFLTRASSA